MGLRWRFMKRWFAGIEFKRIDDHGYDGHFDENSIIVLLRHRFL